MKNRYTVLTAALFFTLIVSVASAQTPAAIPSAPSHQGPAIETRPAASGAVSTPRAAPVDPLPAADPRFFTAASPTVETVNSFLKQVWGVDPSRIYRVMAIQPTIAPGVVKVTVFLTTKAADAKVQSATFYVTPDGKHAIGEGSGVVSFGAAPFAATRDLLKAHADGASRGAAPKDLELVEFADLQCPHCKEAQPIMDQIVKDFPNAHVVFQLFPLVDIHPSAFKAAAYGHCVQKQSNDAFFKFAEGVYDTQEALSPATDDTLLKAAVVRSGLDGTTIAECAAMQSTKDAVNADIKLASDAGIDQTPLLSVNGRLLPLTGISYDALKQLIQFQATLDGVNSGATAATLAPSPKPPVLSTLPK